MLSLNFYSLIIHPWKQSQPALVMNVEQQPSVEKERKRIFSVLTGILPVWKNQTEQEK